MRTRPDPHRDASARKGWLRQTSSRAVTRAACKRPETGRIVIHRMDHAAKSAQMNTPDKRFSESEWCDQQSAPLTTRDTRPRPLNSGKPHHPSDPDTGRMIDRVSPFRQVAKPP